MSDPPTTCCPHVKETKSFDHLSFGDVLKESCQICDFTGPSRWLCLNADCQAVLCGSKHLSHSDSHFTDTQHPLQVNLKSLSVWCNMCDGQVSLISNIPGWEIGKLLDEQKNRVERRRSAASSSQSASLDSAYASRDLPTSTTGSEEPKMPIASVGRKYMEKEAPTTYFGNGETDERFEETSEGPRGLTGLANLGNTCYANASLQALCNCVPLQEYFASGLMDDRPDIRPGLATAFKRLLTELWSPKRLSYVVPHGCLTAVRTFYPMFRGYSQHDSQEFIRCFLDQLHEELKQSVYEWEMSETELQLIENKGRLKDEKPMELGTCSRLSSKSSLLSCDQTSSDGSNYETADSGCSLDSGKGKILGKRKRRRRQRAKVDIPPPDSSTSSSDNETTKKPPVSSIIVAKRKPVKFRSIVSDVFDGKILSSVQCLSCKRISRTVETFQDLSVSIPTYEQVSLLRASASQSQINSTGDANEGWIAWFQSYFRGWFSGMTVTLEDCFAAFFSTDELKGDDMYSCDECKKLRNGAKHCELLELPEVLSVHLKRFKHEFMYSSKISTHVAFPLEGLDLKPYIHKDCHNKVTKYDLSAVICHHGSAGGGHYTAYCLNYIDHRWYEFDDNTVTQVDQSTVENCEAYILFYKKNADKMMKIREEVDNLFAQQPAQMQFVKFYVSQEWVNRFNTFSEPGPISNYDFLCPHGCISPDKVPNLNNLYTEIPSQVWRKILEEFGGGPVCSNLFHCYPCQNEARQLLVRREREKQTFRQLEKETNNSRPADHHYVISMRWFKEWEQFITDLKYGPPGPIDNTDILVKKNDQFVLRQGCHYAQVQRDMWEFFYLAYSGGPEIIYNPTNPYVPMVNLTPMIKGTHDSTEETSSEEKEAEIPSVKMPVELKRVATEEEMPTGSDSPTVAN